MHLLVSMIVDIFNGLITILKLICCRDNRNVDKVKWLHGTVFLKNQLLNHEKK